MNDVKSMKASIPMDEKEEEAEERKREKMGEIFHFLGVEIAPGDGQAWSG